jgi:hypothetical protein
MMLYVIEILAQVIAAYLLGTIAFDLVHYLFHCFLESNNKILKAIGHIHLIHHRFYTSELKVQPEWAKKNLLYHVCIEYLVHIVTILTCILFFNPIAITIAILFETCIFLSVCYCKGQDAHHKTYEVLPAYRGGLFVNAEYHAMHHLHPTKFFSSMIKLLDYVLGSACHLKGKHIVMTGSNGALGSHMKTLLEKEGATVTGIKFGLDYDYHNYEGLTEKLAKADILFLCHGTKFENAQQANCDSFVSIIELFKKVCKPSKEPLEIWGVGSEIECHPCFGIKKIKVYAASKRNYAKFARRYYRDKNIQYRHLVHSAFISPMGPGLMTASFAAKMTLFFIKRGFKYVPVTYTGFAWLNYFRFLLNK